MKTRGNARRSSSSCRPFKTSSSSNVSSSLPGFPSASFPADRANSAAFALSFPASSALRRASSAASFAAAASLPAAPSDGFAPSLSFGRFTGGGFEPDDSSGFVLVSLGCVVHGIEGVQTDVSFVRVHLSNNLGLWFPTPLHLMKGNKRVRLTHRVVPRVVCCSRVLACTAATPPSLPPVFSFASASICCSCVDFSNEGSVID